ncbi:hypothetical protein [Hellea balneolensis]|uniref:hypothetical protein n=1 Tax=Hellea balneolensis TaxID=287478 RepID=UPI0012B81786|nr:hypothetical protein [Hellea balneolensis]
MDDTEIIHLTGNDGIKIEPLLSIQERGQIIWVRRLGVSQSKAQIIERAKRISKYRKYSIVKYDCVDFITELLVAKPKLRLRHLIIGSAAIGVGAFLFRNKFS